MSKDKPIVTKAHLKHEVFLSKHFFVPYYQRPYAWGAVEIKQLLQDIYNSKVCKPAGSEYYIGNIVCSPCEADAQTNHLKIIDGQQRLTTLFLILATLERKIGDRDTTCKTLFVNENTLRLSYLARDNDNAELLSYCKGQKDSFEHFSFETARQVVEEFKRENGLDGVNNNREFIEYLLEYVSFVLVQLPLGLDYAAYYEVMNTHVKQLEKHETLKALILSKIEKASVETSENYDYAAIWDACSQMDRWIDFGFGVETVDSGKKGKETFVKALVEKDPTPVLALFKSSSDANVAEKKYTLNSLLASTWCDKQVNLTVQAITEEEGRIGSIVNFPTFLLLVYALETDQGKAVLDDSKLLETIWDEKKSGFKNERVEAKHFISRMLYWRILFDQYIIKSIRENSDKTRWLIRPLEKPSNSETSTLKRENNEFEPVFRMMQALLHVAGIPKKEWLYPLMMSLDKEGIDKAKKSLLDLELDIRTCRLLKCDLNDGLQTDHYAFFALDYELWCRYSNAESMKKLVVVGDKNYKPQHDFIFRFRNSVEHVFPQNPEKESRWEYACLNGFGNLALITQSSNSSYSNQLPASKRRDFTKSDQIESMKLLEIYQEDNFKVWEKDHGVDHGDKMIQVLIDSFPKDEYYERVRQTLFAQMSEEGQKKSTISGGMLEYFDLQRTAPQ